MSTDVSVPLSVNLPTTNQTRINRFDPLLSTISLITPLASPVMAEAAGLTIGTIALASLFSTTIECLEYVDLARNHGKDYEVAEVKLLLLKGRLNAWGESLRVSSPGNEHPELRRRWDDVQSTVKTSLEAVAYLFGHIETLQEKYGLRKVDASSSDLTTYHASERVDQVANAFRTAVQIRRKNTSMPRKAVWAIHDRQKFNSFLSDLSDIIGSLEKLCEGLGAYDILAQFFQAMLQNVSGSDGRAAIEDALRGVTNNGGVRPAQISASPSPGPATQMPEGQMRPLTDESSSPSKVLGSSLQNTNGDLFIDNSVEGNAKGLIGVIGDVDRDPAKAGRATFKKNKIQNNAQGGIGIFSGSVAEALFKN